MSHESASTETFSTAAARIFWIMIGPLLLVLLLTGIVTGKNGWFTPTDFGFLAVLGAMILARKHEFSGGNPRTSTGEPAEPAQLRRYVLATLVIGIGVWLLANLIGNHWLEG